MIKALRRRNTYVDLPVQGSLLRRVATHWSMFFVAVLGVWSLMIVGLGNPAESLVERLRAEVPNLLILAIIMLAMLPAFMLDTLRLSNRFAGPMCRLRRALRELGQTGHTDPVKFRDSDFWRAAAEEFNSVLARVQRQEAELRELRIRLGAGAKAAVPAE